MKLASLKNGRDGRLVVVSHDLAYYTDAGLIAPTLQAALDEWERCEPLLRALYESLEHGGVPKERFHEREAHSPLPRAYQFADGSAYLNHVQLVRKASKSDVPQNLLSDPLMYQAGCDGFHAPRDPIPLADEAWGCDLEGEIAIITDDVPQGINAEDALEHIKLVMLCNDVSLRYLAKPELEKGLGFFQSKPASSFSPVAVTPDELGDAWKEGRLHMPLSIDIDDVPFGRANAGVGMIFNFGELIAHAAKTRNLCAGTIIGSGTVSNKDDDSEYGRPISKGGVGYSCIIEARTFDKISGCETITPFLKYGQKIRIFVQDARGHSIFGAIEQKITTKM